MTNKRSGTPQGNLALVRGLAPAPALALLASLYFAQGVPFGFFSQALPVLMRSRAYSLEWIGLSSLLALPWALKWLWAPLVDRFCFRRLGRRRSWILPLQAASVLTLAALATWGDARGLDVLLIGCFISNLLASTQDVATDGLAVETLRVEARGLGNGVQVAGYRTGMVLGGGPLLVLFERRGWSAATWALAGALLVASLPVAFYNETRRHPMTATTHGASVASYLRQPGVRSWLLVLVVFKFGDAVATGMLRPFLVDRGYSLSDIGWSLGTLGSLAGLVGALAGGMLVNRLGVRLALLSFGMLSAISVGLYCYASASSIDTATLAVLLGFENFAGGMATVALFTTMMQFSRAGSEGTDYTIQASVVVVGTGLAHSLSGFSAARLGYTLHFGLASVAAAFAAAAAWCLLPRVTSAVASWVQS